MRPYVSEVEYTIQGGGKHKLGPKTLIVGPNAAGKSTIVRAIELAGSGSATDIGGKAEVSLDADLAALGPGDIAGSMVLFSDVGASTWTLAKGKRAKRDGREIVFPVRDLRGSIVGKSVENVRKFFLSVAADISWDDVLREIPEQFHEKLKPYKLKTGADSLLAAIDGTKRRVREIASEAKALRENARIQMQGLPPEASPELIRQARESNGMKNAGKLIADLYVERDRCRHEAIEFRKRLDDALHAREDLPAAMTMDDVVRHAVEVMKFTADRKPAACYICASPIDAVKIGERARGIRAKLEAALTVARQREAAEAALARARSDDEQAQRALVSIVRRLEENGLDVNGTFGAGSDAAVGTPPFDFEEVIRVSERWASIRQSEGRAVNLEADATILAQVTEVCSTALERLLTKSIGAFEQRVQRYLPAAMEFGIELRDGDREVCRVGLRKGGFALNSEMLRTALCGAEWATMTAALASALAEKIPETTPVVIIVEDRDFDPKTLGEVMAAFSKIDAQVIITGTKLPTSVPDGWTVIQMTGMASQTYAPTKPRPVNSSTSYCDECDMLIIGSDTCPHGVKPKPRVASDVTGDIFAS